MSHIKLKFLNDTIYKSIKTLKHLGGEKKQLKVILEDSKKIMYRVVVVTKILKGLFMKFNIFVLKCLWKSKGPRICNELLKTIKTETFIL